MNQYLFRAPKLHENCIVLVPMSGRSRNGRGVRDERLQRVMGRWVSVRYVQTHRGKHGVCVSTLWSLRAKCEVTPLLDVRRSTRVPGIISVSFEMSSSPVPTCTMSVSRNRAIPMLVPLSLLKVRAVHPRPASPADAALHDIPDDIPIAMLLFQRPCGI